MTIRQTPAPPTEIFAALERRKGRFTDMLTVFHCIRLSEMNWVGVAGDGENGSYEHFAFREGKLICSDKGYGSTDVALRRVLEQEVV